MSEKLEDWFLSLAKSNDENGDIQLPLKGVTVRLDAHMRAEIAALSTSTYTPRQTLLEAFIESGLNTATEAYLSNSSAKVQADFAHDVYEFLVAEGVAPRLAEAMAGVQIDLFNGEHHQ